jgi:hypothetical protein
MDAKPLHPGTQLHGRSTHQSLIRLGRREPLGVGCASTLRFEQQSRALKKKNTA